MNYKPPIIIETLSWTDPHLANYGMVKDGDGNQVPWSEVLALLNNRSIVEWVPEGASLQRLVFDNAPNGTLCWRADLYWMSGDTSVGYGPTPEAAIQNAKENIHE